MSEPVVIEILTNTRCKIHGLLPGLVRQIDDALAIAQEGAHFNTTVRRGMWDGRKHLFYVETCTFPKGLLSKVEQLLGEAGVAYTIKDSRKRVLPPAKLSRLRTGMLEGIAFGEGDYSYQMEAARAALAAGSGILWLATNAGKTEIASAMMKVLRDYRCLYVVGKKGLLHDARERIAKRFGTIEEEIGIIGDGRFDPKHITIAVVNSLAISKKRSPKKWALVRELLRSVDVLFLDECHHGKATTWYRVANTCNAQFRYGLSGTPFGSGNGLMVEAITGPVVARISNEELIKRGVSAKPTVRMVAVDEPQMDPGGAWDIVYKEGVVCNTHRNNLILLEAARYVAHRKPTLILVRELWHGDLLSTMLKSRRIRHEFVHGATSMGELRDAKARFEDGTTPVLIASPIFDEGVDVPAIQALIIADGGKSVRSVLQKVGRGLRRKKGGVSNTVEITDFADFTHKWLAKHSAERIVIYEGEGFEIAEVTPEEVIIPVKKPRKSGHVVLPFAVRRHVA